MENLKDKVYDKEKYAVYITSNALGDDNKYGHPGYAVVNKEYAIVEHTTTMMPGAIFQCDHFNDTLVSLLSKPDAEKANVLTLAEMPTEDVVPS